ncbi:MAG: hypothetical protein KDK00_11930 [Rhodobacteraceae bacterium]|nr:hypothetical protein [Paracoccaceae bacterium]
MITLLNWLVLLAFAAAAIFVARWVVDATSNRWQGGRSGLAFAFLYLMLLATIAGLSFVTASVIYYEILFQGEFLRLQGLAGLAKAVLIFAGVGYAARYALGLRKPQEAPK